VAAYGDREGALSVLQCVHEVAGELALGLVEELGEIGGFGTLAPVDAAVLLT
jgi:hypothetical protein